MGYIGTIRTIGAIRSIGTIRRGYHSPISPILPILPIVPIFPINSTSISEINLLSEGCRVLHSAKMPPMGSTRRTSHWWHFLLGAAIDPLSQQITRSRYYHYHNDVHQHRCQRCKYPSRRQRHHRTRSQELPDSHSLPYA